MCPGSKDFVSVRDDGKSVNKQKYLLMCKLNDLFVK